MGMVWEISSVSRNRPLGGEVDGGPGQPVAVPAVLQHGGDPGDLGADHLHPVVVELLAQPEPDAVALHESGDADPRAVRHRPDRLVQRAVVAGDLQADVGASPVGQFADPFGDGPSPASSTMSAPSSLARSRRAAIPSTPITRAPLSRAS